MPATSELIPMFSFLPDEVTPTHLLSGFPYVWILWILLNFPHQLLAQNCVTQTCLLLGFFPGVHCDLTIMIVSLDVHQRRCPYKWPAPSHNTDLYWSSLVLIVYVMWLKKYIYNIYIYNSYLLTRSRQDDVPALSAIEEQEQAIFTFAKPLILMNFDSFGPTWGVQHWQLTDAFLSNKL